MKRLTLTLGLIAAACMSAPQLAAASAPPHDSTVATAVGPSASYVVMTIHPFATVAPAFARPLAQAAPSVRAAQVQRGVPTAPNSSPFDLLVPLGGLLLMGAVKTTAADKNTPFATDTVRAQLNAAIADIYYFLLNRPAWQVAAAAVAPPVCARGGTASKAKTTATTQLFLNGIPLSLTATDDLWTFTGGILAVSSFRRYLLLWDGTSATTVVSVLASTDAATAAGCTWPTRVPNGTGIVGIATIATDATHPFTPGTTNLNATGITTTFIDGIDDSVILSAQVTP